MRKLAILLALLWIGPAFAQDPRLTSYFQLTQTPNYLANGGPGFVQIDANGHPFIAASVPGSGTVTNAANLANNAMVVGDGGGAGIKTVGGSIGGSFTTAGAVSLTGGASGVTFALPAGGPFTYTYPLATATLASLAGTETLTNKTYSGGVLSGTFSGTPTYSGVPKFTGLSAGTQVSCLGLDSSNNVVLLGAGCSAGGGGSLTVGTSTIASGTTTRVLFDNAGVLGEYTISGTGNVAMTTSPTFTTPALGTPSALVGTNITGTAAGFTAGTVTTNANLTGPVTSVGNATAIANGAIGLAKIGGEVDGNCIVGAGGVWTAGSCSAGGSVSVTASTPDIVITPSPGLTTFTVGTTLVQNAPADGGSHSYTVVSGDITKEIALVNTFTALVVPQATGSFGAGSQFTVCNSGAITATSTTSTINGIAGATGIKLGALTCSRWISSSGQWIVLAGVPTDPTQRSSAFLTGDNKFSTFGADFTSASNVTNLAQRTTHGDSNYTIVSTDRYIVTSATQTAARTYTLPAANTLPAGTQYQIYDEAGGVSATNSLAIAPNGSDTINGVNNASSSTIAVAYGGFTLKTDGSTKWTATANTIQQAYSCSAGTFASAQSATGVTTCSPGATTIASGAKALATAAIASAACTSAQTDTATGTATTDVVTASFNGDPTAVTGYVPLTTGMLTIISYPTTNTVNFKVCNNTSASITPGAITLNWRVVR